MEQLIEFVKHCFKSCRNASDYEAKRNFFHQAFGEVKFYIQKHPLQESEVYKMWEEMREKFISEIYD